MKAFPYEVSEQPPAPYVDVEIKPSFSTVSPLRYRAKVDSGAAMTVNKKFTQLEVTLSLRANVLLGRDVLNHLRIVLNGPNQITEILD